MPHDKIGPKEAQQRALREARVSSNKRLIDTKTKVKAKAIGRVTSVKAAKPGGGARGR
jgi:hypothetical protein